MKKGVICSFLTVLGLFFLFSRIYFAQEEREGSKDHTLFNRPPGTSIYQYEDAEFDAHILRDEKERESKVEGLRYFSQYDYKEGLKSSVGALFAMGCPVNADQGSQVTIPISITSTIPVASFQLELIFNTAQLTYASVSKGTSTFSSGKDIQKMDISVGRIRFLVQGTNQIPIPDGVVLNVTFNITVGLATGTQVAMSCDKVYAANPTGNLVPAGFLNGSCTITVDGSTKTYGLFIGVYQGYHFGSGFLPNSAHEDANGIKNALDHYYTFTKIENVPIVLELNYDAPAPDHWGVIRAAIIEIGAKMAANDKFIFYYSGHGAKDDAPGSKYRSLAVQDPSIKITDIPVGAQVINTDLTSWLKEYLPSSSQKIVILDTCYSGGFWVDIALQQLLPNITFLASTGADSYSMRYISSDENKSGRNIYTWYLIEGLQFQPQLSPSYAIADINKNGLTFNELHDYVSSKMLFDQQQLFSGQDLPVSTLISAIGIAKWTNISNSIAGSTGEIGTGYPNYFKVYLPFIIK